MKQEQTLATKTMPAGAFGYRVPMRFEVHGGLRFIRGNSAPYFTLTCDYYRKGFPEQCQGGGADHEEILKHFPRFADLAALHLSDVDGAPMHAVENGFYWLRGSINGTADKSREDCLAIFAKHCRIDLDEARRIQHHIRSLLREQSEAVAKEALTVHLDKMRPRWMQEAGECIRNHRLRVVGDSWGFAVTKDGDTIEDGFPTYGHAWEFILKHQGQSVDYAMKHGGYAIRDDRPEGTK